MAATLSSGPFQLIVRQNETGTFETIIWPAKARQWKPSQSMLPPLP